MSVAQTHADGNKKNRHGADLNLSVAQAKHAVSRQDPCADKSRLAAEHAKATWRGGADRK
jgi:hypothetical protein